MAVSACGGGGAHTVPVAKPAATAIPLGSAQVALTIPNRIPASSERRTQYVSASTASVTFVANPGAVTTTVNLTGSICVPNANATAKVCTFAVSARVGSDTFSITAFDGSGHALSAASSFNATIAEGQNNTLLPMIMGGIPKTLTATYSDGTTVATLNGAASKPLTITVYDYAGNIIVAPGAFVDDTGAPAPIAFTSSAATTHLGYTDTPAATGVTSPLGATVSLAEPDDVVALAYDGAGYVPPIDTFSHALVPNHSGGGPATQFSLGWVMTPAFPAKIISSLTAAQFTTLGHQGVLIADQGHNIGFVGDVSGNCSILQSESGSPISQIGGIATDLGTSDPYVYANVSDPSVSGNQAFDTLQISQVAASNCTLVNQAVPISYLTPSGIAAANSQLYGVGTTGDYIFNATLPNPPTVTSHEMDGGTDFGTSAVNVSADGTHAIVQFSDKRKVDLIAAGGGDIASAGLGTLMDANYPYGMTVDTSGDIFANDMTVGTFGSIGGVDEFSSTLSTKIGSVFLNAPVATGGPNGAIQNMTVGPYEGSSALFVACTDGIEVAALPLTASSTPFTTIAPVAAANSAVANGDGRIWLVLSDGRLEALPPY